MARKYSQDALFKNFMSTTPEPGPTPEPEHSIEKPSEESPSAHTISTPEPEQKQESVVSSAKAKTKKRLVQKAYYLTPELVDALALRVFKERSNKIDLSYVVRLALEKELAQELLELKKEMEKE